MSPVQTRGDSARTKPVVRFSFSTDGAGAGTRGLGLPVVSGGSA